MRTADQVLVLHDAGYAALAEHDIPADEGCLDLPAPGPFTAGSGALDDSGLPCGFLSLKRAGIPHETVQHSGADALLLICQGVRSVVEHALPSSFLLR